MPNISNWLSFDEVIKDLNIKDFVIFDFLQEGLQPYLKSRKPFMCPSEYHEYFHIITHICNIQNKFGSLKNDLKFLKNKKQLNTIRIEYKPIIEDFFSDIDIPLKIYKNKREKIFISFDKKEVIKIEQFLKNYTEENTELKQKLNNIIENDYKAENWKYLIIPDSIDKTNKLIEILKNTFYKSDDIEKLKVELSITDKNKSNLIESEYDNNQDGEDFKIDEDNSEVRINGKPISLTPNQLKVVKIYYEKYEKGIYKYSEIKACIDAEINSDTLRDVFKKHSDRLDTLFEKVLPRLYRLKIGQKK